MRQAFVVALEEREPLTESGGDPGCLFGEIAISRAEHHHSSSQLGESLGGFESEVDPFLIGEPGHHPDDWLGAGLPTQLGGEMTADLTFAAGVGDVVLDREIGVGGRVPHLGVDPVEDPREVVAPSGERVVRPEACRGT